jgi:hypothetical protein
MRATALVWSGVLTMCAACAAGTAGGVERGAEEERDGPSGAVLAVDNRTPSDATIYVVRSGARERLGLAGALGVRWFAVPGRLVTGPTQLSFVADPVGDDAEPRTEDLTVEPGDTVEMVLQPN